jgi:enoyl-CoA hydratase
VLEVAQRIALIPSDIVQLNKRTVHRQMDIMGLRAGIRAGTELCALGIHQATMQEFITEMRSQGLTKALQERDEPFGDYRTSTP